MTETKSKHKNIEGHVLNFAFEIDGLSYWEFPDILTAPVSRMMATTTYGSEFEMRCSREYLLGHCQAVEEQMNGKNGSVDFMKVAQLHLQLKERLQFIFEPDTAYKYASVIFIDDDEDPFTYDFKYNQKKIKRWKEKSPSSFFLTMPVKKLFPLLDISEENFQDYLIVQKKVQLSQLDFLLSILSKNNSTQEYYHILESHKQEILESMK